MSTSRSLGSTCRGVRPCASLSHTAARAYAAVRSSARSVMSKAAAMLPGNGAAGRFEWFRVALMIAPP